MTDRHATVERQCEQCGELFLARVERVNAGQGRFCSRECSNTYQREHSEKLLGFEHGKKYWDGNRWVVRWYDETGKVHTTSYAKWWWTLHKGEVPEGYNVTYKDGNPDNIKGSNFVLVHKVSISNENLKNVKNPGGSGRFKKGHGFSDETKKKMSEVRTGKKLTEDHKLHIGNASRKSWAKGIFDKIHKGKYNYMWRGGHDEKYPSEYYEIRLFILDRDKYVCQVCGKGLSGSTDTRVHHRDGNKKNNDMENLLSLCSWCHHRVHTNTPTNDVIMSLRSELLWNQ